MRLEWIQSVSNGGEPVGRWSETFVSYLMLIIFWVDGRHKVHLMRGTFALNLSDEKPWSVLDCIYTDDQDVTVPKGIPLIWSS